MAYKQAVVVRADLKLPKGKLGVQVAHAAVESTLKSDKKKVKQWRREGQKKIVVKVKDKAELLQLNQQAKDLGLTTASITDAGLTAIAPGTLTCIGMGPDEEERIDNIIGKLKLV